MATEGLEQMRIEAEDYMPDTGRVMTRLLTSNTVPAGGDGRGGSSPSVGGRTKGYKFRVETKCRVQMVRPRIAIGEEGGGEQVTEKSHGVLTVPWNMLIDESEVVDVVCESGDSYRVEIMQEILQTEPITRKYSVSRIDGAQ